MPFGLTNAPAAFQRAMDVVLAGLKYNQCLVYLDDVVVFGSSFDEHNRRLKSVLSAFRCANLTIKAQKCTFGTQKMLFLGHVVDHHGIRTDPSKTKAIQDFPAPRNINEVRSFMGLAGYYRKIHQGFLQDRGTHHQPYKEKCKIQLDRQARAVLSKDQRATLC